MEHHERRLLTQDGAQRVFDDAELLVGGNRDDHDVILGLYDLREVCDLGHLVEAELACRVPEVQDDDLAAVAVEIDRLAVDVFQIEAGRAPVRPGVVRLEQTRRRALPSALAVTGDVDEAVHTDRRRNDEQQVRTGKKQALRGRAFGHRPTILARC